MSFETAGDVNCRAFVLPEVLADSSAWTCPADLNALSPEQLRALATQLIARVEDRDREIEEKTREVGEKERELRYRQTRIDQLTPRDIDSQTVSVRQAQRAAQRRSDESAG